MKSVDFSTGRYDGASAYRVGSYSDNAECRCFVATGPYRRF